ncbi:sodium:proton exchanger [Acidiferrobacter sp. SPIII_3]|nr:sodium:proton exchanger [Acidiferrobacter sp. SPIII_3]
MALALLLVALPVILAGAELFTNAIEHVGAAFGVSEGVTGSLFAAVGTALPETAVPLLGSLHPGAGERLAVGAVLGAPLMLSTLTMGVMGAAAWQSRGPAAALTPERAGLKRDLDWFLALFALALGGLFLPGGLWRHALATILVAGYIGYVTATLRASRALVAAGHETAAHARLHLARRVLKRLPGLRYIQLLLGLAGILAGAQGFVVGIEGLGRLLDVPVLVLALVIVPIATELPEKINSVLWVRRRQDTLAFGNITGALVFQGSLLPALGLTLTPWRPSALLLVTMLITMAGAGMLRLRLRGATTIRPYHIAAGGLLYAAFLGYLLVA